MIINYSIIENNESSHPNHFYLEHSRLRHLNANLIKLAFKKRHKVVISDKTSSKLSFLRKASVVLNFFNINILKNEYVTSLKIEDIIIVYANCISQLEIKIRLEFKRAMKGNINNQRIKIKITRDDILEHFNLEYLKTLNEEVIQENKKFKETIERKERESDEQLFKLNIQFEFEEITSKYRKRAIEYHKMNSRRLRFKKDEYDKILFECITALNENQTNYLRSIKL